MPNDALVKVLFRIPEADRRALKVIAAKQDTSSTELVRRMIRSFLDEEVDPTGTGTAEAS